MHNCLITTDEIRNLASNISGETVESIKGLISYWQDTNNKSYDTYPSRDELVNFIKEVRGDNTRFYSEEELNDIKDRDSFNKEYTGEIGSNIANFKKDFIAIVHKVNSHYDGTVTRAKNKINGTLFDDNDYNKYINTLSKTIIAKLNKVGKTIHIHNSTTLNSSMSITNNSNSIDIAYNPKLLAADYDRLDYIVAHELVHAVTSEAINNVFSKKATREETDFTNSIWSIIQELNNDKDFYFRLNDINIDGSRKDRGKYIKEFIANVMTNPSLQDTLSKIKVENNQKISLWNKFINSLKSLIDKFLHRNIDNTYLDRLVSTIALHIDNYTGYNNIDTVDSFIENTDNSNVVKRTSDNINNTEQTEQPAQTIPDKTKDLNNEPFNTPKVLNIDKQEKIDFDLNPRKRRDRAELIANFFSLEVDSLYNKEVESLKYKIANSEGSEQEELKDQFDNLTRTGVIIKYNKKIIKNVLDLFVGYYNSSNDDKIKGELKLINNNKNAYKYTDEEKLNLATKRVQYKNQEYKKIIDNFIQLTEDAKSIIEKNEYVKIQFNNTFSETKNDINISDDTNPNIANVDPEAIIKDGWMTNFREESAVGSLSEEIRRLIRKIPKLKTNGKKEKDDLGFIRNLDSNYVHAFLINRLHNMITSDDLMPTLESLVDGTPWVQGVIDALKSDSKLKTLFYTDFRKDFMSYWTQKTKVEKDGTTTVKTIACNESDGIYYLLDEWRYNYSSGNILDSDSIYDTNGNILKNKAVECSKKLKELVYKFSNKTVEESNKLLENEGNWNELIKLLNAVGISVNQPLLKNSLIKSNSNSTLEVLSKLDIILSGVAKDKIKIKKENDDSINKIDLINEFKKAYSFIAYMINDVSETAIENSAVEKIGSKTKTLYSYVKPNYVNKLIKNLKAVHGDKNRFDSFLQNNFKKYSWFYKNGEWLCDWLEQIENNKEVRDALSIKTVISCDKVDYTDWDSVNYMKTIFAEYTSEPDRNGLCFTNYYLPILSDSPAAQFIRFIKYTNNSEIGKTYQEIISEKLAKVVLQEYNRIALVKKRNEMYHKDKSSIKILDNFDIEGDKRKIGGAEFKFFPALNARMSEIDKNSSSDMLFIDKLDEIMRAGNISAVKSFIISSINNIMESSFEKDYEKWTKIGLFEENEKQKCKYLPFEGPSIQNEKIKNALKEIKNIIGNDAAESTGLNHLLESYNNNEYVNYDTKKTIFSSIKEELLNSIHNGIINVSAANSLMSNLVIDTAIREKLKEFYWNNTLAQTQIIELTTTDLAYYKNIKEFQKRFKEIYAPSQKLDTKAIFNGELVGKEIEKTIIVKDENIVSTAISEITAIVEEKYNNKEITKIDRDYIISQYKNINVTDAQSFRSLSSMRAVLNMCGKWDTPQEEAYIRLKNKKFSMKDFYTLWQTIKPFTYTQTDVNSGVDDSSIKVPVQHKTSEFLLLSIYELMGSKLADSPKMNAITEFMENNNIDVIQFESAVKVGGQGKIDISSEAVNKEIQSIKESSNKEIDEKEAIKNILGRETGIADNNENPNVVHSISYEDYGIQTPTPSHLFGMQLMGTQLRRLGISDMSNDPNFRVNVNDKLMTKKEVIDLYNSIITENIIDTFSTVSDKFKDAESVSKMLIEEMTGNSRYGSDLIKACTLNEKGNFNIPLYDPSQVSKIQSLLNSVIRRVTKQKTKGGALIQVSDFGYTDDLHIVFDIDKNGKKHIKYMECYMPAYSESFYNELLDPITHTLNINKLPDNLRKVIGYRVPTEDKYSMIPLYIKGFLPVQNGSSIMLPSEITTMSGSDFDVDKLYVMFPEFNIIKYDYRRAYDDFNKENKILLEINRLFKGDNLIEDLSNTSVEFKEWFAQNKNQYLLKSSKIRKVYYDDTKTANENNRRARNNEIMDIIWGVLTNSDTAFRVLNPGGFQQQKKASRISELLNVISEDKLRAELNISNNDSILDKLMSMKTSDIEDILASYEEEINPLSPSTQIEFHRQNMTAGKMIGIYANHNSSHALLQNTNLSLSEYGMFTLNDKNLSSLHEIKNNKNQYISRNTCGYLAASVDDVKENVLTGLNQNVFTADSTMLLSRLGYLPIEIGVLMTQPIVMDMTKLYFKERQSGMTKSIAIDKILDSYIPHSSSKKYEGCPLSTEDMIIEKLKANKLNKLSNEEKAQYYKNQETIGQLFKKIAEDAKALGDLTQATRSDTSNGGVGSDIADTLVKIKRVDDLLSKLNDKKYPLQNANIISSGDSINTKDETELRKKLLTSLLPYLQAFYTLGVHSSIDLLNRYFPQLKKPFTDVVNKISNLTASGKLNADIINNIYNSLFVYILTKNSFFGNSDVYDSIDSKGNKIKTITTYEKRKAFLTNFVSYFNKIKTENPDIADNDFIKQLRESPADKNKSLTSIVFNNTGKLTDELKQKYTRDWEYLLYMDNPKANELALNLVRYCFYKKGFSFGSDSFMYLASTSLKMAIPEYVESLNNMLDSNDDYTLFVDQFVYNNLYYKKIVPQVNIDSAKFVDNNDNINNTIDIGPYTVSAENINSFIKRKLYFNNLEFNVYYKFISVNVNNKPVYYKLVGDPTNAAEGDETVTYKRIYPLGEKNSFIEYEYGVDAEDIKSVISQKDSKTNTENTESPTNDRIDLENDDDASDFENDDSLDSEDSTDYFTENIENTILDTVYGEDRNKDFSTIKPDSVLDIEPNINYRDADNKKICGA